MGGVRSRHFLCFAVACGLSGALVGCGSGSPGGLSPSRANALRQQLAMVDNAAAQGNRTAALNALSTFAADVHRDAGSLNAADRAALQTGIARVRARILGSLPVSAPSRTTSTTTPAVTTTTTTTTVSAPTTTASTPATPAGPPGHGPGGHGPPGHGGPAGHDGHGHGPGGGPGASGPGGDGHAGGGGNGQ